MSCNCGICMECDFSRTHFDELGQPLSDTLRLAHLSDIIFRVLVDLKELTDYRNVEEIWNELNQAYEEFGIKN